MAARSPHSLGALGRVEADLVRGRGCYVDDVSFDDELYGHVVRSPHPHADIIAIDTGRARASHGVAAVLTHVDIATEVGALPCAIPLAAFGGEGRAQMNRPVLAADRVRHEGDPVAFVVADTAEHAAQAADALDVTYRVLPHRTAVTALDPDVSIWPDTADDVCFDWRFGDALECERLFASADRVVRISVRIPRVAPYPIEPRAAVGFHDPDTDVMTLYANTQGVHFVRNILAQAFSRPAESIRVVTPNVGGGFGSKIYAYPEHALVLVAARMLGRPVRWTSTRTEAFWSDTQGRGHVTDAAIALDADGHFLALSVRPTVDLGAYLSQLTPVTATAVGAPVQGGAYRFRAIDIGVRGVFTNKVPVDAMRGAGRPEATYVLERLIDTAARETGIDPAELRARNLPDMARDDLTTVTGLVVGGGRFLDNQRRCLQVADRDGFETRRAESERHGRLRGFGFANYLEANGGVQVAQVIAPDSFPVESAALTFHADGSVDVVIGTQSTGQDHEAPMRTWAASRLGVDPARIAVREGDSALLHVGSGTGGSKSTLTSSVALDQAIDDAIGRARLALAAKWGVEEVLFTDEVFTATPDFAASVSEVASDFPGVLDGQSQAHMRRGSSANGCHSCELEIDAQTGVVTILRYVAVDDFGHVINAAAVRGQVQGGVVQGIGQVLMEIAPAPGELTPTGPRYGLPRAADAPDVEWIDNGMVFTGNIMGAKGCGEAGVSVAPPAVMNAIADALRDHPSARDLQMPARPADVWAVIHAGR